MHVKKLQVQGFKAFVDLTIELPSQPSVVILCGENGTGKSSLFDAIGQWRLRKKWGMHDADFFKRGGDRAAAAGVGEIQLQFHEGEALDPLASVYVRTAQRVTVEFANQGVQAIQSAAEMPGPFRSIDIDDRVAENYQRLVAASVEALWNDDQRNRPAGEIVDELVGLIGGPLGRLIPGLSFDRPERPFQQGSTFRFSKAGLIGYSYKNLSGGEKAVFDVLLDTVLKRNEFQDAVWCVDELELHVNPRIQGQLLREMVQLLPESAQLWISTHAIGVMAEALRMYQEDNEAVAFVDLSNLNPAESQTLSASIPSRTFWKRQLEVGLGDMAALIAPSQIVLCEGEPAKGNRSKARWDSRVLEVVFADEFPEVGYFSVGNSDEVVGDRMDLGAAMTALVDGVEVLRVIDRDGRSVEEVRDLAGEDCRVLSRRNLESYLLDGDVLDALCEACEQPEKKEELRQILSDAIQSSVARGKPADDLKSAAGEFMVGARKLLGITAGGNDTHAFLRDTVAPNLKSGMPVYEELRRDVFGN